VSVELGLVTSRDKVQIPSMIYANPLGSRINVTLINKKVDVSTYFSKDMLKQITS
jgi:hypothetical protein